MSEQMKHLRHELRGVVGNLKAIEFLLFSTTPTQNREGVQSTYRSLLGRLDHLLSQMDETGKQVSFSKQEKGTE